MKDKKFLNGTEKGLRTEPATKESSVHSGAADGFVEVTDDILSAIAGGVDGGMFYCDRCRQMFTSSVFDRHSRMCGGSV